MNLDHIGCIQVHSGAFGYIRFAFGYIRVHLGAVGYIWVLSDAIRCIRVQHLIDHSDSAELVVTGQLTCIGDGIGDTAVARLGHDQLPLLDLGEAYAVQPYGTIQLWYSLTLAL